MCKHEIVFKRWRGISHLKSFPFYKDFLPFILTKMFSILCFKHSGGQGFEHQQRLGQKIKAGVQKQSLIPITFIWGICRIILSNVGHPQFLVFSAQRLVSAELELGRVGWHLFSRSEPDFAQRCIFDAWFCSSALPNFTELLWSWGCSLCPFSNLFFSPFAAFGGLLSKEKK